MQNHINDKIINVALLGYNHNYYIHYTCAVNSKHLTLLKWIGWNSEACEWKYLNLLNGLMILWQSLYQGRPTLAG